MVNLYQIGHVDCDGMEWHGQFEFNLHCMLVVFCSYLYNIVDPCFKFFIKIDNHEQANRLLGIPMIKHNFYVQGFYMISLS